MARGRFTLPVPRLAVAALMGTVLLLGSACGDLLSTACGIDPSTVHVGGTGSFHEYRYSMNCGNIFGNVEASWDARTRIAQERFSGSYGTVSAEWVCAFDPWVRLDDQPDFTCTQNWRRGNLDVEERVVQELLTSPPTKYPYSANQLSGSDRLLLNQRLGAALAAAPAPVPSTGPQVELSAVRTKVQVQGDEVRVGTPGVWDIDVRNASPSAASPVEVVFEFSGAVRGALFVPPAGFACPPPNEGARITCQGALGAVSDPLTAWATFTIWVIGEREGPGTLTVTVNPNRRLAEGSFADNATVVQILSRA